MQLLNASDFKVDFKTVQKTDKKHLTFLSKAGREANMTLERWMASTGSFYLSGWL